jgi:hypothetical protein
MNQPFPIYSIADDAAQSEEAMGTKFKFWLQHPDLGDCLFKMARPGTGEDWSEKIAAELCRLLGLPSASYELATWQDTEGNRFPGTLSPSFLTADTTLVHGNDILAGLASSYPREQAYRLSEHTLTSVFNALSSPGLRLPLGWEALPRITSAACVFVGYLLLDAWIGNGDRHHENWGFVIQLPDGIPHLAPTYDHASCLGRELQEKKRREKLQQQTIEQYVKKSRSAFYQQASDRKAVPTFDAFVIKARRYSQSASIWLNQLESITSEDIRGILNRLPKDRMSPVALEFAAQMLDINKTRLLSLREDMF